jgi:thiol-disulfide isomerase/thioredoxin
MKTLKLLLSAVCFIIILFGGKYTLEAASDKTVYYFWAENCSACKEAQAFYRKPADIKDGSSWTYNGIKFIPYKIVDGNNKVISKNINQLTGMCAAIVKRTGTGNIVYFRREIYEYYKNKNLPYYRKEEKYSRKDEPFPTPVFVIGNRVILGFSQDLVQKAIDAAK